MVSVIVSSCGHVMSVYMVAANHLNQGSYASKISVVAWCGGLSFPGDMTFVQLLWGCGQTYAGRSLLHILANYLADGCKEH